MLMFPPNYDSFHTIFSTWKFHFDMASSCPFFQESFGIFHKLNRYFPKAHFLESVMSPVFRIVSEE